MKFYYVVTTDLFQPLMWAPSGSGEQELHLQ